MIVASADKHGSRGRKLVAEARRSDRPAEPSTQDGLAPTTRTLPHLLATEILDCAPDGIIAVDRKGYVLYANRAFAAMLGHEPDDLRRMRVQDLVTPDTTARALDELAVLFSQPTYRGEMVLCRKDGSPVRIDVTGAPASVRSRPVCIMVARGRQTAEEAASQPAQMSRRYGLSKREMEILKLVAEGLPDKQIAQALGISLFTASKHLGHIMVKMGVRSRTEAGVRAVRESLV